MLQNKSFEKRKPHWPCYGTNVLCYAPYLIEPYGRLQFKVLAPCGTRVMLERCYIFLPGAINAYSNSYYCLVHYF